MSHFAVIVLVDEPITRATAEEAITPLLAPYDENQEIFAEGSRWDWWVIGGRWTGRFTPDYDPDTDPVNIERCPLCGGTGDRAAWRAEAREIQVPSGCNGCEGKGERVKWNLEPYEGDVRRVEDLPEDVSCMALVTPDGQWHEQGRMGWWGLVIEDETGHGEKPQDLWQATVRSLLDGHPQAYAVIVDCHV